MAYLGAGGNGDVWFAVTTDFKRCCAVKFFNSSGEYSKRQLAQMEAHNWKLVYGDGKSPLPSCHVGYMGGTTEENAAQAYLCMPYLGQVPKRMWYMLRPDSPLAGDDLERALRRFVDAGYKQGSLRWEHLGFFPVDDNNGNENEEGNNNDDGGDGGGSTLEIYMFDLGRIEKFDDNDDTDAWVQESLRTFIELLPLTYEEGW